MLKPPPRNLDGSVQPHDHEGILNTDDLIRRISPQFVVTDDKGQKRISTMAFRASSGVNGSMSVDLQREIEEAGLSCDAYVSSPPWIGSVKFTAGQLRQLALLVGYDPLPPDLPHHGGVWGGFTKSQQKQIIGLAVWFIPIQDVILQA